MERETCARPNRFMIGHKKKGKLDDDFIKICWWPGRARQSEVERVLAQLPSRIKKKKEEDEDGAECCKQEAERKVSL